MLVVPSPSVKTRHSNARTPLRLGHNTARVEGPAATLEGRLELYSTYHAKTTDNELWTVGNRGIYYNRQQHPRNTRVGSGSVKKTSSSPLTLTHLRKTTPPHTPPFSNLDHGRLVREASVCACIQLVVRLASIIRRQKKPAPSRNNYLQKPLASSVVDGTILSAVLADDKR